MLYAVWSCLFLVLLLLAVLTSSLSNPFSSRASSEFARTPGVLLT